LQPNTADERRVGTRTSATSAIFTSLYRVGASVLLFTFLEDRFIFLPIAVWYHWKGGEGMPATDKIHIAVRNALVNDGWTVTADPFTIRYEEMIVFADLAAERLLALERGSEKIAVEIKTFAGRSPVHDLETALGQYMVYASLLRRVAPERRLYLAIADTVFDDQFSQKAVQEILYDYPMAVIVVDIAREEIVRWIL
jgi:hypothetical protein